MKNFCVVIKEGMRRPVQLSLKKAKTEANRLAAENPGEAYYVMQTYEGYLYPLGGVTVMSREEMEKTEVP